jgi:hypothetical protein
MLAEVAFIPRENSTNTILAGVPWSDEGMESQVCIKSRAGSKMGFAGERKNHKQFKKLIHCDLSPPNLY